MLWFIKLPPGKHCNWHFRAPKKTFSQIPLAARDPPSCAYLNGKTTLRPWNFLINYRPNTKKVIELIARWPMVSYQLHLLTNAFRRNLNFIGIRKDKISFFPQHFFLRAHAHHYHTKAKSEKRSFIETSLNRKSKFVSQRKRRERTSAYNKHWKL